MKEIYVVAVWKMGGVMIPRKLKYSYPENESAPTPETVTGWSIRGDRFNRLRGDKFESVIVSEFIWFGLEAEWVRAWDSNTSISEINQRAALHAA